MLTRSSCHTEIFRFADFSIAINAPMQRSAGEHTIRPYAALLGIVSLMIAALPRAT
jgi:hypothetical protein